VRGRKDGRRRKGNEGRDQYNLSMKEKKKRRYLISPSIPFDETNRKKGVGFGRRKIYR